MKRSKMGQGWIVAAASFCAGVKTAVAGVGGVASLFTLVSVASGGAASISAMGGVPTILILGIGTWILGESAVRGFREAPRKAVATFGAAVTLGFMALGWCGLTKSVSSQVDVDPPALKKSLDLKNTPIQCGSKVNCYRVGKTVYTAPKPA